MRAREEADRTGRSPKYGKRDETRTFARRGCRVDQFVNFANRAVESFGVERAGGPGKFPFLPRRRKRREKSSSDCAKESEVKTRNPFVGFGRTCLYR